MSALFLVRARTVLSIYDDYSMQKVTGKMLCFQVCAFTTGRNTLRARSGRMAALTTASVWMLFLENTNAQRSQFCFISTCFYSHSRFLGT